MLTFNTPSGVASIENKWSELSPAQFVGTCALTNRFFAGEFDIDEYRLRLLELLSGYKRKKKRSKFAEQINENLFLISEQLTFAVRPKVGPVEVLDFFSPDLREQLKTRFPWEIYEHKYLKQLLPVKSLLKIEFELNLDLGRNLLPQVRKNKSVYSAPYFDTFDGDIYTNVTAEQYLDASDYFNAYSETKKEKYLDSFIDCLYNKQSTPRCANIPSLAKKETKDAIILVFMYMQQTFINDPVFKHLFTKPEQDENNALASVSKLNLGSAEALLQVVETGYGSLPEVKQMNIVDFFNIQLMIIKNSIAKLRAMDKKPGEIARTMNLSVETVTQF